MWCALCIGGAGTQVESCEVLGMLIGAANLCRGDMVVEIKFEFGNPVKSQLELAKWCGETAGSRGAKKIL